MPEWFDASQTSYTAESTVINGHIVTVCLDDEGPIRPCYYWDVNDRETDGWAATVAQARRAAIAAARALPRGAQ